MKELDLTSYDVRFEDGIWFSDEAGRFMWWSEVKWYNTNAIAPHDWQDWQLLVGNAFTLKARILELNGGAM